MVSAGVLNSGITHRLALAALFRMTTDALNAVEKYWIVHEASLIVVGTLHSYPIFPWFDGWPLDDTIEADEVVFRTKPPGPIAYRWTKYSMCNNWRALISPLPPLGVPLTD